MIEEVKVKRNYQVAIPASARAKMGVKVGDILLADYRESKLVLERKSSDITKLRIKLGKKTDWRDVEKNCSRGWGANI